MKAADESPFAEPSLAQSGARPARVLVLVAWALLALAYVASFHMDVRARDAFSWMDPYQYYLFAKGVAAGSLAFDESAVPSVFPFFVVPFVGGDQASVSGALWVNVVFAAFLAGAVHALCRRLRLAVPSVAVAAAVLASPLLLGLSRTLYVELSLTAVVAVTFAVLLRWIDTGRGRDLAVFAVLLAAGLMMKMTFPVFFLAPLAGVAWCCVRERRYASLGALVAASVAAVVGVLAIQYAVFPASFRYYTSFGNTSIPVMRLIGPPDVLSLGSIGYYPRVVVTSMLLLLSPFALLALRRGGSSPERAIPAPTPRLLLWLWLVGPLLILTLQPVKEPRHVAPCVVPAMLLVFSGVGGLREGVRRIATAAVLFLALAPGVAIAAGVIHVPYYLRGNAGHDAVEAAMLAADPNGLDASVPADQRWAQWKFRQNVALDGFDPNAALALTWSLFPAVVFDLEQFRIDDGDSETAFDTFEDLYVLTAFNTYNRRAGWMRPYATLGEKAVVTHADYVLLGPDAVSAVDRFPDHELVATVPTTGGDVRVLRTTRATEAYRALYARRFLRRHPDLKGPVRTSVGYELLLTALLERDLAALPDILRSFPELADPRDRRRIYWMSAYQPLHAHAIAWMAENAPQ